LNISSSNGVMELLMTDDFLLVEKANQGKISAFREIVERYKKKIYYLAYDLTGHQQDAEDLSQEVFLKAFRALSKYRGEASLHSWLYRITVNSFIDTKRKLSSKMENQPEELTEQIKLNSGQNGSTVQYNPETYTESQQIQHHIQCALDQLSTRERSVFVMKHFQAQTIKDISQALSISDGTVKSLLFRAIRKLQKELAFYKNSKKKEVNQ